MSGKGPKTFEGELSHIMYGFGDEQEPSSDSVKLLNDLVVEWLKTKSIKASTTNRSTRRFGAKKVINLRAVMFQFRNDRRKTQRIVELLHMQEEIEQSKKQGLESINAASTTKLEMDKAKAKAAAEE